LQIVETNQQCPEAWCIVGKCYSSQNDHESAVSFFERAIRIHLTFAHAYTLLGHEHVYNDELSRSARGSMYRLQYCLFLSPFTAFAHFATVPGPPLTSGIRDCTTLSPAVPKLDAADIFSRPDDFLIVVADTPGLIPNLSGNIASSCTDIAILIRHDLQGHRG
jgi:hypothetical protein